MEKNGFAKERAKLLLVQLHDVLGLKEAQSHIKIDFDHFGFHHAAVRTSQDNLRLFSGVFYASGSMASVLPFSIAFFNGMREDTNLNNMSLPFHRGSLQASILSYLAVLDFIKDIGSINHTLEEYMHRLTDGGRYTVRQQYVNQYAAHKASMLKRIPYDTEQALLAVA